MARILPKFLSLREWFHLLVVWSAVSCIFYAFLQLTKSLKNHSTSDFRSMPDILSGDYLVDNELCRIPKVSPWRGRVLQLYQNVSSSNCQSQPYSNLTYVSNGTLVINEAVLNAEGYHFSDVYCCYRTIDRVKKSLRQYDREADNKFSYSACHPMTRVTTPNSGFIRVTCKSSPEVRSLLYENFHLVPILPPEGRASSLGRKLSYWRRKSQSGDNRPPNILILGLDSTSRLNFRRFMPQTARLLQRLHSVEMRGYTKVGENTFPNLVPLLTSLSEKELVKLCYPNRWTAQDGCPYIWRQFSKRGYLTSLLEDSPKYSIFNYLKTAFVKAPVDAYLRPFMLAAYGDRDVATCLGNQRPEELIFKYVVDLVTLADSRGLPYFILSWMTDLTHDNMNNLQLADELFERWILHLQDRGLLNNTLLLVMSDHGYRFLDVRQTGQGWFEDKLPTLWVKVPENRPEWEEALKLNSGKLMTPFDLHEMFKELLGLGRGSSLRGMSPFKNIPARTCDQAGIPAEFCPCRVPVAYEANLTFIGRAGQFLIDKINLGLPSVCQRLEVGTITTSAQLNLSELSGLGGTGNISSLPEVLIIGIVTTPGDFKFEAQIRFNRGSGLFEKLEGLLRTNRIERSTGCLINEDKLAFEQRCYC